MDLLSNSFAATHYSSLITVLERDLNYLLENSQGKGKSFTWNALLPYLNDIIPLPFISASLFALLVQFAGKLKHIFFGHSDSDKCQVILYHILSEHSKSHKDMSLMCINSIVDHEPSEPKKITPTHSHAISLGMLASLVSLNSKSSDLAFFVSSYLDSFKRYTAKAVDTFVWLVFVISATSMIEDIPVMRDEVLNIMNELLEKAISEMTVSRDANLPIVLACCLYNVRRFREFNVTDAYVSHIAIALHSILTEPQEWTETDVVKTFIGSASAARVIENCVNDLFDYLGSVLMGTSYHGDSYFLVLNLIDDGLCNWKEKRQENGIIIKCLDMYLCLGMELDQESSVRRLIHIILDSFNSTPIVLDWLSAKLSMFGNVSSPVAMREIVKSRMDQLYCYLEDSRELCLSKIQMLVTVTECLFDPVDVEMVIWRLWNYTVDAELAPKCICGIRRLSKCLGDKTESVIRELSMQLYKDNPHLLDLLWCLLEMVLGNCKSNIADYDWWPGVFKYAMKAPESRLGESILETLIDVHPSICTARSSFFRAALNRGEIAVYYLLALHQSILSKPDPALFSILSKAAETYPNRRKRLIALLIQSDYTALATAAT